MRKFLGRLLLLLIAAAVAGYLLFPLASDQYMLYQNEPRLRIYQQWVIGYGETRTAIAKNLITDWNNAQIQDGIIPLEDGGRRVPWISEGEMARLAEALGEPPKEQKDIRTRLLSPMNSDLAVLTPRLAARLTRRFLQADGVIQPLRVQDPFSAESSGAASLLSKDRNGVIGILEIPGIGVTLPVYGSGGQDHLETGLFYGPGSSLPIGGGGTHAVLAGSGGLEPPGVLADIKLTDVSVEGFRLPDIRLDGPKMLSDMDQLAQGDLFLFSILGQTMVYQIETVSPLPAGQDILLERTISGERMTIVSATRDGGRLAVTGIRIVPEENSETLLRENAASSPPDWVKILVLAVPCFIIGLLVMFIVERVKHRRYRLPTERKEE